MAGCEVNVVQSEALEKEFGVSNRRSPAKAASEEDEGGKEEEPNASVESYVDKDNDGPQLAAAAMYSR